MNILEKKTYMIFLSWTLRIKAIIFSHQKERRRAKTFKNKE